ncbi:heat shock 70 kDa protein 12A-like isoform X2 [Ruditapes philippinarum]|nr:heat shock 70 kDa protein 12A-like isoform X2 [Ruditapes philippinarum]
MATASKQATKTGTRMIVAAIDIGTTYSGWAYSTLTEPEKIYANQAWFADGGSLASLKTASCILFTPEKEFKHFGYEAETSFASLAEDDEHWGWYYFRRFKMLLNENHKLNRYTTIEDISGKKMPALVIFANAIKFLKDNFFATIRKRVTNITDTDVIYVLTVPAIWDDMAKRFMRDAAVEAGISNDQLIIALEPEAASIWCQELQTEFQRSDDENVLGISAIGTRYMVVDLGGGTADITVHERRPNNTLLEIHKPIGGPWGGTEVDKNFTKLLKRIFGSVEWERFEQNDLEDLLHIYRDFEAKKRNCHLNSSDQVTLKVPSSLKEYYEENDKKTTAEIEKKFDKHITWKKDKLRIEASVLEKCFETPINKIVSTVREVLSKKKLRNVSRIILVGGFAESIYVQDRFKANFADKQIIIPPDCGLAVLKGAVLFGHNPSIVTARIARYSYGLDIAVPFDHTKHPKEKMVDSNIGKFCLNTFWKAVEIGQQVEDGYVVSRIGKAVDDFQRKLVLNVVKSTQNDPLFTTDKGCEVIGEIVVPMDCTLKADDNAVEEMFIFGGTELRFQAKHITRGDTHVLNIDL